LSKYSFNNKFSIVTPTYNAGKYLDQTIRSIVSQQGDFEIEHIIVDNASTDNTLEIAKSYRAQLDEPDRAGQTGCVSLTIVSAKDHSMYEAINRGFALATGQIYAWINADDIYLPGAFQQVASVFAAMPEVKWLKGTTSYIDEAGDPVSPGVCYLYAQNLIKRGLYGREGYFIQQDSVFWREDLWKASGGVDESFRLAGDYDLWMRFAEREPLYTLDYPTSSFRRVSGQLSEDLLAYRQEQQRITRNCRFKDLLLRWFFSSLEPRLPDWMKFLLFRALCPLTPLYLVEVVSGTIRLRKSFKYMD